MENLGFGQILLLIVFILVPLFNFLMRRLRKPVESETPANEPVPDPPRRVRPAPESPPPPPRAPRNRAREMQGPVALTPPARRHFTKSSLFATPRDVRRGIILMAILGPCRAFDP